MMRPRLEDIYYCHPSEANLKSRDLVFGLATFHAGLSFTLTPWYVDHLPSPSTATVGDTSEPERENAFTISRASH